MWGHAHSHGHPRMADNTQNPFLPTSGAPSGGWVKTRRAYACVCESMYPMTITVKKKLCVQGWVGKKLCAQGCGALNKLCVQDAVDKTISACKDAGGAGDRRPARRRGPLQPVGETAAAGLLGCLQGQPGRGDISNNKQKKIINNKSKTINIVDYILINRK